MWNISRRSELCLPQTLGTQCEGNSCLLTSQWTCWEQRQSLMFPFISYYLLASSEVIKYTQSTCPEERITWDQFLIPMEQILFENLGNLYIAASQLFLESSCILPHTPFLLNHFPIDTGLNGFLFFIAKQSSLRNICPRLKFMLQQKLSHTIELQN